MPHHLPTQQDYHVKRLTPALLRKHRRCMPHSPLDSSSELWRGTNTIYSGPLESGNFCVFQCHCCKPCRNREWQSRCWPRLWSAADVCSPRSRSLQHIQGENLSQECTLTPLQMFHSTTQYSVWSQIMWYCPRFALQGHKDTSSICQHMTTIWQLPGLGQHAFRSHMISLATASGCCNTLLNPDTNSTLKVCWV